MEASQVLYRRETGFVAQTSDLCLRHKSQLSKDPAGSTPLVSCRLTDEHDRLSTRRSSGNGPEVYCGSRGLASASQRGPFFHSTESQSHNGLSFGICGLTPKFSAAAVPFFSIRLSDWCGATQKTRRRDDSLHKTQPLWLIRRYTSTTITRLITGNIKLSVQGSLAGAQQRGRRRVDQRAASASLFSCIGGEGSGARLDVRINCACRSLLLDA